VLTLVLSAAGAATADTRIASEERTRFSMGDQDNDTTTEVTLWLAKDRAARLTSAGRMISRLDRGEAYLVNDAQKTYTVIEMSNGGALAASTAKVERSGERRTIGSWSAERYDIDFEISGQPGHAVFWMSTDVDVERDDYRAYMQGVAQAMGMAWFEALAEIEGFPVLQEVTAGPVHVTSRVVSITQEAPPAGLYDPPAGYERKE
jgi:hypothetical protein